MIVAYRYLTDGAREDLTIHSGLPVGCDGPFLVEIDSIPVPEDVPPREYVGIVWVGDAPGVRVSVWAGSLDEALEVVVGAFGEEAVISLWNEEDAAKPR